MVHFFYQIHRINQLWYNLKII